MKKAARVVGGWFNGIFILRQIRNKKYIFPVLLKFSLLRQISNSRKRHSLLSAQVLSPLLYTIHVYEYVNRVFNLRFYCGSINFVSLVYSCIENLGFSIAQLHISVFLFGKDDHCLRYNFLIFQF